MLLSILNPKELKINTIRSPEKGKKTNFEKIRVCINNASIDNVGSVLKTLRQFTDHNDRQFITEYLYKTYRTVKEHPHPEIIKRLAISNDVLDLFQRDLNDECIKDAEFQKFLKFKMCLISILYKEKSLNKKKVVEILSNIINPIQAEVVIYFLHMGFQIWTIYR